MKKFGWLICLFVFVFVTSFIVSVDTSSQRKKVQFSNQNFQINNEGNKISNNSNTKINLSGSNINNKDINATNTKINNANVLINTGETDINTSSSFNNRNIDYNNQSINLDDSEQLNFKNLDNSELDAALKNAKNYSSNASYNKPFKQMHRDRYQYKNIDWNTWKSNFVNQILDDSLSIKELDNYNYGTLIYYSFVVDKAGRISNIQVKSLNVSTEDKQKLARLIKSYEYGEMTIFPANTQRQTSTVSAVMMLSNESQYSNPSDFNEFERVKFKL